jgi:hypothetical protein
MPWLSFARPVLQNTELKVYINSEKNYKTYRRAWGESNTEAETKEATIIGATTASTIAATVAATATIAAATITTTTSKASTPTLAKA